MDGSGQKVVDLAMYRAAHSDRRAVVMRATWPRGPRVLTPAKIRHRQRMLAYLTAGRAQSVVQGT